MGFLAERIFVLAPKLKLSCGIPLRSPREMKSAPPLANCPLYRIRPAGRKIVQFLHKPTMSNLDVPSPLAASGLKETSTSRLR